MQKNYYVILGVGSGATLEEIKSAFRRRAMELHPDRSGLGDRPFQELLEAYGVLSDSERRKIYDWCHRSAAVRRHPWGSSVEPLVSPRVAAQTFSQVRENWMGRKIRINQSFGRFAPSFEEIFDRLWGNFYGASHPEAEQLESLTVEVVINPTEAMRGGSVLLTIPGKATCPTCGGRGAMDFFECWRCEGLGTLAKEYPLQVPFPQCLRDGHVARLSLDAFGIKNFFLTIIFRISRGMIEE